MIFLELDDVLAIACEVLGLEVPVTSTVVGLIDQPTVRAPRRPMGTSRPLKITGTRFALGAARPFGVP